MNEPNFSDPPDPSADGGCEKLAAGGGRGGGGLAEGGGGGGGGNPLGDAFIDNGGLGGVLTPGLGSVTVFGI